MNEYIYKHNFRNGDIIRDEEYCETFKFNDSVDGFKAENTDIFRLATDLEVDEYSSEKIKAEMEDAQERESIYPKG